MHTQTVVESVFAYLHHCFDETHDAASVNDKAYLQWRQQVLKYIIS